MIRRHIDHLIEPNLNQFYMLRVALHRVTKPLVSSYTPRFSINNWKMPSFEMDTAGISGFFDASTEAHLTLSQKLADLSARSLYTGFDEWTRELLVTLSVDLNCGFASSIIIATIIIKTIFLYPTLKGQLMGLRQKELKSLSDQYKQKMKVAQMTHNKALMTQASYDYKMSLKKKGINNTLPMLNFFQIPILITWFLSLRYMSNLPEIYPQMLTDGYFWFEDLSTYDPYFLLPVLAACTTSISIARSPNLARNNVSLPFLAPYVKYLKFLPFASLAFTSFFPASINLYWLTLAGYQLMITQMMYSKWIIKKLGGQRRSFSQNEKPHFYGTAVFVTEKKTSEEVMKSAEAEKKKEETENKKDDQDEEEEIEEEQKQKKTKKSPPLPTQQTKQTTFNKINKAKTAVERKQSFNKVKIVMKKPKIKKDTTD